MAVLFATGFDHYVTAQVVKRWSTVGVTGPGDIFPSEGRCGTNAMLLSSITIVNKGLVLSGGASVNKGFMGWAYKYRGSSFGTEFFRIYNPTATSYHLQGLITVIGQIQVLDNLGNVLATTDPGVVHTNEYGFIEIGFVISTTVGEVTIRYNNVELAHETLLNTQQGGSNVYSGFGLTNSNNASAFVDDVYFCDDFDDGLSPKTNTFLGDVHVEYCRPESDGTYAGEWAVVGGGTQFNAVDKDGNPTATTPSIQSLVNGNRATDNYFAAAVVSGTVFNVGVHILAQKSDSGPVLIAPLVRRAGVDALGSNFSPPQSASIYESTEYNRDPTDGSAWSIAKFNAAEYGVEDTR